MSIKKLNAAVIYLPTLAGILLVAMIAVIIRLRKRHIRMISPILKQLLSQESTLASTTHQMSLCEIELDAKQQQLAMIQEMTRRDRAKVKRLRHEVGELVASGGRVAMTFMT